MAFVFMVATSDARRSDELWNATHNKGDEATQIAGIGSILSGYLLAAETTSNDLDEIYRRTQSHAQEWHMDPDGIARVFFDPRETFELRRSGMVGDIYIVDGKAHMVNSFGFRPLPDEFAVALMKSHPTTALKVEG